MTAHQTHIPGVTKYDGTRALCGAGPWGVSELTNATSFGKLAIAPPGGLAPGVDCRECLTAAGFSAPPAGRKDDATKPRWDLMPWDALAQVTDVLTLGAVKYAPDNWRVVPDHRRRYVAAAFRHLVAYARGETQDPESGLHHLAHCVCCLLFLIAREGGKP